MEEIIRIEDLGKTYSSRSGEVRALQGVNLTINKGEIFGIIGMSGAGKSTLVRCMNLLERPTEGKVLFEGKNLCELTKKELNETRRSIAMIFQQFNLLMQRSVLKNVRYPLELIGMKKAEADAKALEYLKIVGLEEKADAYPSQLSGGQKQRVAIARALASNPRVLLCDEATSALDPKTTRQILELIKEINRTMGITVVVITHEMSVIEEICSRVAIIDNSMIAESGPVTEVFSNPKTDSAKRLVFGHRENHPEFEMNDCKLVRIVFDGNSSFEPVISNMILDCRIPVNIMRADTRNIDGKAFGQIILQIPSEEKQYAKIIAYLNEKNIKAEEVTKDAL